ncbi:MAG: hypothetical protein XU08_C0002G0017 [candidate division WWE3 bacterium CSP1-7]|uniref:Uncharacterized protein n=1 Tax=candidate division WWE3 bacterium CSP1-7 TaxID=1576480 RepID=A0A0T5ZXJ3_UNCKA|nr:MAG: hypothetical protein XU08_C0002G0017 [candidate division WWE3 bacterium CSP1-7]
MVRNRLGRSALVALVVLLGLAGYLSYFFLYNSLKYSGLMKDFSAADAVQTYYFNTSTAASEKSISEENLVEIAPNFVEERQVIVAFSTGEFYELLMNDANTGEYLTKGVVMKVVSKNSLGLAKSFDVVLQVTDPEDPQKPVTPAFVGYANKFEEEDRRIELSRLFSIDEIKNLFPRGSKWVFVPLGSSDFLSGGYQKYAYLASRYQGSDYPEVQSYISGGLIGSTSRPVLLFDLLDFNSAVDNLNAKK